MRRVAVEFGRALLAALLLVALAYGGSAIATSVGSGSPTVSITLTQGISAVSGTFSGDVGIAGNLGVTGTLGVTGAASVSGGLTVEQSTTNTIGATITGNGTASGAQISGGDGATNVSGLVVRGGGSSGSLGTPSVTTGAIVAQGKGGGYGICAKGGNTNGATAALFEGTGSAGRALDANSSGIVAAFTGDTTSPTWGTLRLTPLNADPTSCQVGDLYMTTSGVLRVCTATTPTWVNVGSQ